MILFSKKTFSFCLFISCIQVETAFFWRWWKQQDNATKELVQELVDQVEEEELMSVECISGPTRVHRRWLVHG